MARAKTLIRFSLVFLCAFSTSLVILHGDPALSPPPVIPAALEAPSNQTLALVLTARGVQIYECRPVVGQSAKFEWAFKAPEADLFDARGKKIGRHSAGPTWELLGGGKVVGRVKAKADAPDGQGIPWLLLEATQSEGDGIMAKALSIQRVDTIGGKAPTGPVDPANAGQEARVPYTATYRFYIAKPAGLP